MKLFFFRVVTVGKTSTILTVSVLLTVFFTVHESLPRPQAQSNIIAAYVSGDCFWH
jgi:hypothetical protein